MEQELDFLERLLVRQEVLKRELERDIPISEIIAITIADQLKDQSYFSNTEILD